MGDYYDQLEAQLAALTARGAHRRRLSLSSFVARIRTGGLAGALAVAVVVVIAVVFLSAGRHSPVVSSPRTDGGHGSGGTAGHHNSTSQVPPPQGIVVCQTTLRPPSGSGPATGIARIYEQSLGHFVLWATASGIDGKREQYEVWIDDGAGKARRIGVAYHPRGARTELAAQLTLPGGAAGYRAVLITRQPREVPPSPVATKPRGQIVLEGSISF